MEKRFTAKRKKYEESPKKCRNCGLEIPYHLRDNIFCNHSCSCKYNNPLREYRGKGKPCHHCSSVIYRNNTKYCSNECRISCATVIRNEYLQKWKLGLVIGGRQDGGIFRCVRKFLLEEAGCKCSCCGWNEVNPLTNSSPLGIDHIDGNSQNHQYENLRVLCPNCHSLTPTYGSLNMGFGRKHRRKAQ